MPDNGGLWSRFIAHSRNVCWLSISSNGTVVAHNAAAETMMGRHAGLLTGWSLWTLVTDADAATLRCVLDDGRRGARITSRIVNFICADGNPRTLATHIEVDRQGMLIFGEPMVEDEAALRDELLAMNNDLAVLVRENQRQKKALEAVTLELQSTTKELQESYWHIRKIQEVLPICMQCGKVKTEHSVWQDVVDFLKQQSLFLSHGYCPTCAAGMLAHFRAKQNRDIPNSI
ncbi:MAG TPA: PAS domain-containing protein [Bryobacteraceae bacterium]|nr:PAS domain-containing protein [Bryobacteraceae bacterium]